MEKVQLFDALDGLYAYDKGCSSSGIKDDVLKRKVKNYLNDLEPEEFRLIMTEFIREYFVSEEAVSKRYGIEDVAKFLTWMANELYIDLL